HFTPAPPDAVNLASLHAGKRLHIRANQYCRIQFLNSRQSPTDVQVNNDLTLSENSRSMFRRELGRVHWIAFLIFSAFAQHTGRNDGRNGKQRCSSCGLLNKGSSGFLSFFFHTIFVYLESRV